MAEHIMTKPKQSGRRPPPTQAAAPSAPAPKRGAARATTAKKPPKGLESAVIDLEATALEFKRERDALAAKLAEANAELAVARAEIASLEIARRTAIDRIDWVIDSLQTVLQDKA